MTETWTALAAARRQRLACADDVRDIRQSCVKAHGKKHVAGCSECLTRVVDRMNRRYTDSLDQEWLTGSSGFLGELQGLFLEVSHRPNEIGTVEQYLKRARESWIRQAVGGCQTARALLKTTTGQAQLIPQLEDQTFGPGSLLANLLDDIATALGSNNEGRKLDARLARLTDPSATDPSASDALLVQATQEMFFPAPNRHRVADGNDVGLQAFKSGTPLDSVMASVLDRSASCRALGDLKEKHQRRLDEIRRARAAHLKTRRTRNRRAAAEKDKPQTPGTLYDLRACANCSAVPDHKAFLSCALCQVFAGLDGQTNHPIVYCSNACSADEFEAHLNTVHTCSAGDACIDVQDASYGEGADHGGPAVVLCSECLLSLGVATSYCSAVCAAVDFQRHRECVHLLERRRLHIAVDDAEHLVYDGSAGTKYRAKNIHDHVETLEHVLEEFARKNSVVVQPLL